MVWDWFGCVRVPLLRCRKPLEPLIPRYITCNVLLEKAMSNLRHISDAIDDDATQDGIHPSAGPFVRVILLLLSGETLF